MNKKEIALTIREQKILNMVEDTKYTPMTIKEIAFFIEVPEAEFDELNSIIEKLLNDGHLMITKKGKIISPKSKGFIRGTFDATSRGFGFVRIPFEDNDVFIPKDKVNGATHKDTVLVKVTTGNSMSKKREGEIVKIIEKGKSTFVGLYQENRNFGFVKIDNEKFSDDIFIPKAKKNGAVDGSKVYVLVTKDKTDSQNAEGEILNVLGHKDDVGVDVLSIVYDNDIPVEFPDEVIESLENIPDEVDEKDLAGRLDLTGIPMVTIDGEDAKDLDDAVSVTILPNGNYKLVVSIADVTNYVLENTPLDEEAKLRGTSVYLVDRVIPMLPHKLSNGICSLNENVLRLALSAIMEVDKNGKVVSSDVYKSFIKTKRRMSYTIVNDLLTDENSKYLDEYKELLPMFKDMKDLRDILLEKRKKRGAIEFNTVESKVLLDEKGKPTDIVIRQRNVATSIIEEFMLLANETVAEQFYFLNIPFLYRVHEEPDEEKLEKLKDFIGYFGYYLKGSSNHPKTIQQLLEKIKDTDFDTIISSVALKSMKKAEYKASLDKHFGLSASYYSHFTSPIRRYPDLQIHRIIKEYLDGKMDKDRLNHYEQILPEVAEHSSVTERRAETAERETDKLKKCEYMADKIGNEYEGVISSVTSWGLYVTLENTVEGMVSINSMIDDMYIYEEDKYAYTGRKKSYKLGQKVNVVVDKVDTFHRKIDFVFSCDSEN